VRAKKSVQIESLTMIYGICLQRAASNRVWTFRPFPGGLDTGTAAPWQWKRTVICDANTALRKHSVWHLHQPAIRKLTWLHSEWQD